MTTYHVGDTRKVRTVFRDESGASVWPASLTATVRKPDGTILPVTPTPVTVDIDGELGVKAVETLLPTFDAAGVWEWRVAGSAGVTEADQGLLVVVPPAAVAAS